MKNRLLPALCIALAFAACTHKKGIVTTFAGTGIPGNADGDKSEATFSNLMGVAADSAGNVFIADSRNNVIRKIDADGAVTTIAGSGRQGSADGKGTAASFFFPGGIAMGPGGALYVADTQNSLVRRIAPDGTVSTLAGRSNAQIDKRRDTVAKINRLYGIVADPNGNVYISDWERDQVKKIAPNGKISVVAGSGSKGAKDGKADSASFYLPEGLTLDKQGNLYVADTYNNMIRKITPNGMVSTFAGRGTRGSSDGKGFAATFSHPDGLSIDSHGNIYVADAGNNKIRKITPDGTVSTLAGNGKRGTENGPLKSASFWRPFDVTVGPGNVLYVADYQNNTVRKISL